MPPKTDKPLCIRCPDSESAFFDGHSQDNNFSACCVKHHLNQEIDTLWWGFQSDTSPHHLNTDDPQVSYDILEQAKGLDAGSKKPKFGTKKYNDRIEELKRKKKVATFENTTITKQILEAALNKVVAETKAGWQPQTQQEQPLPSTSDPANIGSMDAAIADITKKTGEAGLGDSETSNPVTSSAGEINSPSREQVEAFTVSADRIDTVCPRYCPLGRSHRNDLLAKTIMPEQIPLPWYEEGSLELLPSDELKFPSAARTEENRKNADKARQGYLKALPEAAVELYPLRKDFTTAGGAQVLTNSFRITLSPKTVLHEYTVINLPEGCTRSKRRMLILDMLEMDQDLYEKKEYLATDHYNKIISSKPLHEAGTEAGDVVREVRVPNFQRGVRNHQVETLVLRLCYTASHSMQGLNDYVAGTNEGYTDRGAIEALNIVLSKGVSDHQKGGDNFAVGKNRFYHRPAYDELSSNSPDRVNLLSIRGYHTRIKPGVDTILLNVNTVTSVFYKPTTLDKYLAYFRKDTNAAQGKLWEKTKDHLTGLRVYINFSRSQQNDDKTIDCNSRRKKTLSGLGRFPDQQNITIDNVNTNVWDHVNRKYPRNSLASAKEYHTGNVGHTNAPNQKFYLASQLTVLSDQLYRKTPMPAEITEQMIQKARRSPSVNGRLILDEGLAALRSSSNDLPQMLKDLGIDIGSNMVSVPARVIDGPAIRYRDTTPIETRRRGLWDIPEPVKFSTVAFDEKEPAKLQFFRDSGDMKYPHQEMAYLRNFMQLHTANGMRRLEPLDGALKFKQIKQWDLTELQAELATFKGRISLAVFVFPSANADSREHYAIFKIVMDQILGIKSICLNEERMLSSCRKLSETRLDLDEYPLNDTQLAKYMRNVSMKINLRYGNYNHTVDFSKTYEKINCNNTIILGADVSHPGSGSLRGTPSIAAVVGSVGSNFAIFPGSMRLNPSREEPIEQMENMVTERLLDWSKKNANTMPMNILFYRDGVSESQYAEIRKKEIKAIHNAWNKAYAEVKKKNIMLLPKPKGAPFITALIVTKRHHTRLFPLVKEHTSMKGGNCVPGLVVDASITNPYYLDFFLQSNVVPAGATARPTHYFVLENEMKLSARELQNFTHHLCFTYARSNNAVSYVPPTYYADRLCERGRLYLQPLHDELRAYNKNSDGRSALTEDDVKDKAKGYFYRNGLERKNPWHENHDGKMFWM